MTDKSGDKTRSIVYWRVYAGTLGPRMAIRYADDGEEDRPALPVEVKMFDEQERLRAGWLAADQIIAARSSLSKARLDQSRDAAKLAGFGDGAEWARSSYTPVAPQVAAIAEVVLNEGFATNISAFKLATEILRLNAPLPESPPTSAEDQDFSIFAEANALTEQAINAAGQASPFAIAPVTSPEPAPAAPPEGQTPRTEAHLNGATFVTPTFARQLERELADQTALALKWATAYERAFRSEQEAPASANAPSREKIEDLARWCSSYISDLDRGESQWVAMVEHIVSQAASSSTTPACSYCTSDNPAIRGTYYDQTCEGCVKRMGQ